MCFKRNGMTEIESDKDLVLKVFNKYKNIWVPTKRSGNQCLGNTFEDLMDIPENNRNESDMAEIELKTQRNSRRALITLFSQAPKDPNFSNAKLRDIYGYDLDGKGKKLYSTVGIKGTYNKKAKKFFILNFNDETEELRLLIKNSKDSDQVEDFVQTWDYEIFKKAVINKLSHIALISGVDRIVKDENQVFFTKVEFIKGFTEDKLFEAFKNNHLKLDLRLGVHDSGPLEGTYHDHGTGFRISYGNLLKYTQIEEHI